MVEPDREFYEEWDYTDYSRVSLRKGEQAEDEGLRILALQAVCLVTKIICLEESHEPSDFAERQQSVNALLSTDMLVLNRAEKLAEEMVAEINAPNVRKGWMEIEDVISGIITSKFLSRQDLVIDPPSGTSFSN